MTHVIVLDSLNEDIFVCGLCKSVFNSLTVFLDHKRQTCSNEILAANISHRSDVLLENNTNKLIRNGDQAEVYQYSTSTSAQETIINNEEILGCKVCNKTFKKTKSLLTHMKTHVEKLHQCLICGRCFGQNSHLQRHITSHKVWQEGISETTAKSSDVELSSYSCRYCHIVHSNYSQFRIHLKTHSNLKKFKCVQNECRDFFDTMDDLLAHVVKAHPSPVYTCHHCGANYNTLESFANHQQCHLHESNKSETQIKRYKCTLCDAVFKRQEKLSLHMVTENHNKICIHCNKIFVSDKRLRMHLQIHGKIKPFRCNVCNSSFLLKKYLMAHMTKHGNKQFKCGICKNMFKRHDLLQRHMRIHLMKKKIQCPYKDTLGCKKEFSRKDKLQLHVKCHAKSTLVQNNNPQLTLVKNNVDNTNTENLVSINI